MDKKNVQFSKTQIFYGKLVDCDHNEKLWCGNQKNNFNFVMIKFYIYINKNDLGVFYYHFI